MSVWSIKSKGQQQVVAPNPHNMCSLSSPIRVRQPAWTISHQPSDHFSLSPSFSMQERRGKENKKILGHRNRLSIIWNVTQHFSTCCLPKIYSKITILFAYSLFETSLSAPHSAPPLRITGCSLPITDLDVQKGNLMFSFRFPLLCHWRRKNCMIYLLFLLKLLRQGHSIAPGWKKLVNKIEMLFPWTVIASSSSINAVSSQRKPH